MTPRGDDPVFVAEMRAVTEEKRKHRLPGDGKIDMGDGVRMYPCEARVEMERRSPRIKGPDAPKWPWENMWPEPITAHHHSEPAS